jgi:hypothetical protein
MEQQWGHGAFNRTEEGFRPQLVAGAAWEDASGLSPRGGIA